MKVYWNLFSLLNINTNSISQNYGTINVMYTIFEIELKFWVISVFSLSTNTANHITPINMTRL